jgi:hypothetical protein
VAWHQSSDGRRLDELAATIDDLPALLPLLLTNAKAQYRLRDLNDWLSSVAGPATVALKSIRCISVECLD